MALASFIPADKADVLARSKDFMMAGMTGKTVYMPTFWKGYRFIPAFQAEPAKYAYENYDAKEDSVYVITYPKTGTNWSLEVVRQIMFGHDEQQDAISKAMPPAMLFLEMGEAEKFQIYDHIPLARNLFMSHLPEELFNFERVKRKNGKVIVVLRNPKDQAVSWFHFTQKHNKLVDGVRDEFSSDWPEFLSYYTQGKQPTISKDGEWYPDHILGWYKRKDDPNLLFVYFEDMKKDLKKEIRRMAKFIDVNLDEGRVEKIAHATGFSSMKQQAETKVGKVGEMRGTLNMMRKGQVGQWKELFTVAQSEMMDQLIEEKLGKTDIKFTYEF